MGSNIIKTLNYGENIVKNMKGNTYLEEASLLLLPPKIPHRLDKSK